MNSVTANDTMIAVNSKHTVQDTRTCSYYPESELYPTGADVDLAANVGRRRRYFSVTSFSTSSE